MNFVLPYPIWKYSSIFQSKWQSLEFLLSFLFHCYKGAEDFELVAYKQVGAASLKTLREEGSNLTPGLKDFSRHNTQPDNAQPLKSPAQFVSFVKVGLPTARD